VDRAPMRLCCRPRAAAAGGDPAEPALRKGREVVPSQNHQRIDRPLLPDRPPSGRLVSGTGGQAGVDGHASVWTISGLDGVSGRLSHAGHQRGRVVLAAAAADMTTLRSAKTNQSGSSRSRV
jgi:hypothetical protein